MGVYMTREVCFPRKGAGAEGALVSEVGEERWHDLGVIAAVSFFTESLVFKGVSPGGVAPFLMGAEFVKLVGGERGDAKEGLEEFLRVFVINREDGIDGEWGEQDVDD